MAATEYTTYAMTARCLFLLISISAGTPALSPEPPPPDFLTIHTMPHTHCDPGYKKTFEGYFVTEVRPILLSVTSALRQDVDEDRRFIWSEYAEKPHPQQSTRPHPAFTPGPHHNSQARQLFSSGGLKGPVMKRT